MQGGKMSSEFAVGLYSLPPYNPAYMHPAIAYLTGTLIARMPGIKVHQEDLNTSSLAHLLGPKLIAPMRDVEVYGDFQAFKKAREAIAVKIAEATGGRLTIRRNTVKYRCGQDYKSREGLLRAIETKKDHLYYDFFRERVLPQIESRGIGVVGLSVSDQKQFVPAAVLSSMIKDRFGRGVRVVLGGNIITRDYEILSRDDELNRRLFDYFDFLIHHEGETAFTELVKELRTSQGVSRVPKLIYRSGGRVQENLEFVVEDVDSLPIPNFEGLVQQGDHWTPQPVIPYLIGRGCDWGGCSFCDIPAGYDGSRSRMEVETGKKFKLVSATESERGAGIVGKGGKRVQSLDKVVAELEELSSRYKTKYFSFGDEELAGDLLRDFVERVSEKGPEIEWDCYGRIEPLYLDEGFCRKLRKAGCRFIQFGIESASQAVLDRNQKGYALNIASGVLRNTYEAGIMNHAFLLTGLPGDSLTESAKMIKFLEQYAPLLTTAKPISFKVSRWSPIALHPKRFGVRLDRENTPDLEQRTNVSPDSGMMSRHQSMAFTRLLELWIARHHKPNSATGEYMAPQRLFLSRAQLETFGRRVKPKIKLSEEDSRRVAKVYHGLCEAINLLANSGNIIKPRREQFAGLYKRIRKGELDSSFDKTLELAREFADI